MDVGMEWNAAMAFSSARKKGWFSMAKHLVSCVECGRQFDANKGGLYIQNFRRYMCKDCARRLRLKGRKPGKRHGILWWLFVGWWWWPLIGWWWRLISR